MKYTKSQFKQEYYRLWESGLLLPIPQNASVYSVKYRKNELDQYSRVTLKATSVLDALERACYAITYASPWRPEDIDLHAVYDEEENILWIDEPFYNLIQKKNEFRGMDRRSFLAAFGATSAAILFGLRPRPANGQIIPFSMMNKSGAPSGEQLYTTAGSFNWTVPVSVASVCAVCVGGGGGGSHSGGAGGGGGELRYKNAMAVTSGASLQVVVGSGGTNGGGSGSQSYFVSTSTVCAKGSSGNSGGNGGVGDSGGSGGNGGSGNSNSGGGGGGAGGYSGAGGNGGVGGVGNAGASGSGGGGGGAGGGGHSGPMFDGNTWYYGGSGGGGVGLNGQGSNGSGGSGAVFSASGYSWGGVGGGGSSGASGMNPQNVGFNPQGQYDSASAAYGGGGGSGGNVSGSTFYGQAGGSGAVRIIWGSGRSFPSNAS